jgi:hypothetical protein
MRIRLRKLKELIQQALTEKKYHFGGSHPEEEYSSELLDDPDYEAPSVYVPNDIKDKINKWATDMKLSSKKKK